MKKIILAIFFIQFAIASHAQNQMSNDQKLLKWIAGLPTAQLELEINLTVGPNDAWKDATLSSRILSSVRNLQKQQTWIERSKEGSELSDTDLRDFSYFAFNPGKDGPLLNAYIIAKQARAPNLRPLAVSITSEKRGYANNLPLFGTARRTVLEKKLFYLKSTREPKSLEEYDKILEAIQGMANQLEMAVSTAQQTSMPVLIELESSALDRGKSAVMYHFAKNVLQTYEETSRTSKIADTPSGGKLVVLYSSVAADLSKQLNEVVSFIKRMSFDHKQDISDGFGDRISTALTCPEFFDR